MKIFLTLFLCLFFGLDIFGQTISDENSETPAVEQIVLSRDDGKGNAGQITDSFMTKDIPIHCFVQLNSPQATQIKMVLVAVKAVNLRPEARIVTVNFKTNDKQDSVNFTASPEKYWAAGDYRIDVFLDGKLARSKNLTIHNSSTEIQDKKPEAPKKAARPKVVRKSKKG